MDQQVNVIMDTVRTFMMELGQLLPKLLGAIVILVVGWLIAKTVYFIVSRGLKAISFDVLTEKAGLDGFLKQGGIKTNTVEVISILVYWLIILLTLLIAFNSLGLTVVSELFSRVTQFIPNVIVSVLILAIGLYFARFVSDVLTAYSRNIGLEDAALIARMARYAISIFVIIIALGQINIADRILYPAFLILLGGFVLAMALAFGLGGQKWAGDQLEKFMKKK